MRSPHLLQRRVVLTAESIYSRTGHYKGGGNNRETTHLTQSPDNIRVLEWWPARLGRKVQRLVWIMSPKHQRRRKLLERLTVPPLSVKASDNPTVPRPLSPVPTSSTLFPSNIPVAWRTLSRKVYAEKMSLMRSSNRRGQ